MITKLLIKSTVYTCLCGLTLAWSTPIASAQVQYPTYGTPFVPGTQMNDSVDLEQTADSQKPSSQREPIAIGQMLGMAVIDGGEAGLEGGELVRQGLLQSSVSKGGYRSKKLMKDIAERGNAVGGFLGKIDKGYDASGVLGALAAGIQFDEQGRPMIRPEHVDVIGVVTEGSKNALSAYAVEYGASVGMVYGAEFAAPTGPVGMVAGGLVGGLAGAVIASIGFDKTVGAGIDYAGDAASDLRGTENFPAILERNNALLAQANANFQANEFDAAIQLARQVQGGVQAIMGDRWYGDQARQLNFEALELQGRIARINLEANSRASLPSDAQVVEPPHAASQIMVQGTWYSDERNRVAEVSSMIDVANQKFYGEASGKWLPGPDGGKGLQHTFHLEFHGNYTGNESAGTFEGTGNLRGHNLITGDNYTQPVCTIRGRLENGRVIGTCSNTNGTDAFNLPAN